MPVVCAIHPLQLLRLTDTKAFSKAYRSRMEEAPQSYSTFCVYCLLKPKSFPYINHTCYYQRDYGKVWHYGEYDPADWPRGFMYMTPAETGQGEWATKVVINSPIPYSTCSQWADTTTGRRGSDYEAWKQQHIDRIIDCMELLYPGFRSKCEYIFAAGPLTIRDYYGRCSSLSPAFCHLLCHSLPGGCRSFYRQSPPPRPSSCAPGAAIAG